MVVVKYGKVKVTEKVICGKIIQGRIEMETRKKTVNWNYLTSQRRSSKINTVCLFYQQNQTLYLCTEAGGTIGVEVSYIECKQEPKELDKKKRQILTNIKCRWNMEGKNNTRAQQVLRQNHGQNVEMKAVILRISNKNDGNQLKKRYFTTSQD